MTLQLQEANAGDFVPGTAKLHYDVGAGFVTLDLADLGGGQYRADFPALPCDQLVRWYVSARSTNGIVWTSPSAGPRFTYLSTVATTGTELAYDDAEVLSGWSLSDPGDDATAGYWVQGDPNGTPAQPEHDHTPGAAHNCFYTGQAAPGFHLSAADVDGGRASLTTPALDLSAANDPIVSYWRWYSNDQVDLGYEANADTFLVEVSADGGQQWTTVETIGPTGVETSGGWYYHQFRLADFVAPSADVRVRFVASDYAGDSIIEAAVDDFRVLDTTCVPGPQTYCSAKANSLGCATGIGFDGVPSVTSPQPFDITVSNALSNKNGLFFYGLDANSAPFQGGTICVKTPVKRTPLQNSNGNPPPEDCSGAFGLDFNARIQAGGDPNLTAGTTIYGQYWYRDPADPSGFGTGLTDALQFTIEP